MVKYFEELEDTSNYQLPLINPYDDQKVKIEGAKIPITYLKKHKNSLYQCMLLQGTVEKHLLEIDKAAREREELILKQLEKRYGLPDKKSDYLVWIRAVNQQKAIAEEIILKEPIYI